MPLTRREFLAATNAAALLLLLESCSLGPLGRQSAGPSIPPGSSAYEQAYKLVLEAVRASPDHLSRRAADLASARDATKIVDFVRDRIAVLPPLGASDPISARRWGSAATLRGGQGTLRERADVLADMLTRAGFKAQVMSAHRPSPVTIASLYQPRPSTFAPDQSRLGLATTILHSTGAPAAPSPESFDPGPDAAQAILRSLPASVQKAKLRSDLLPDRIPVVSFTEGNKTRYAIALGDLGITDTAPSGLTPAGDADGLRTVSITVSALTNPAPGSATPQGKLVDLVTGEWPADQVFGRQVLLTFVPPQGPKAILQSGITALPVRIPMLRVQSEGLQGSVTPGQVSFGSLITVHGDVLGPSTTTAASPSPGSGLTGPFGQIAALSDADRAAALARVGSITVSANSSAFPDIELEVAVKDAASAPVDGLDAAAFSIMEEGAGVTAFAMYSNTRTQSRPRVLLVSDVGSQDFWPSATVKSRFESGLDAALTAQAAKTPFDWQFVRTGSPPSPGSWQPPQPGVIASALGHANESADDPWSSVAGPPLDQGVTAIVMVSDMLAGDTDATQLPMYKRRLAAARVPVFALPTGTFVDSATSDQIVALSGGARLDPYDPATPGKLAALIGPLVAGWVGGGYRFRYTAAATGPTHRTVKVGLTSSSKTAGTAMYDVPAQPTPPPSFSGLYVTINFGPYSSIRRIAGLPPAVRGAPRQALDDPGAVAETRGALDGITTIAIEPGTPTTAALLDDAVSSLLSIEPLRRVWSNGGADKILKSVPNGVRRTPLLLALLLGGPNEVAGGLQEMRVAVLQERLLSARSEFQRHLDLAPGLNPVLAVGSDPATAFKAATTAGVRAAMSEAVTLDDSAYNRLRGQSLVALVAGDYRGLDGFVASVPAEKQTSWRTVLAIYDGSHFVVPAAGAADALWVVDPASGAASAVMLDGSGGAIATAECEGPSTIDFINAILALLGLLCTFAIVTAVWFCVGLTVASVGLMVIALFADDFTPGTPFGVMSTIWGSSLDFSIGPGVTSLGKITPIKSIGGRFGVAAVVLLLLAISLEC